MKRPKHIGPDCWCGQPATHMVVFPQAERRARAGRCLEHARTLASSRPRRRVVELPPVLAATS
jgi:hypothetical protein